MTEQDLNGLAARVAEIIEPPRNAFDLSPDDIADIQRLDASLNGAVPESLSAETVERVRSIARSSRFYAPERPKTPTPLDGRIAETARELEAAEAASVGANEVWRSRARKLEAEAAARFHKAAGNRTKIAAVERWLGEGQAALQGFEAEWRLADSAARRARARLNALKLARDRYRWTQAVRIHNPEDPSKPLTLAEFEQRRKQE